VSDWLRIVKKRHIAKAWRREDLRLPCHCDFCRVAIFAACGRGSAANMAALQGHDCCDRARRIDTYRRVRDIQADRGAGAEQPCKTVYKAADEPERDRPNLAPAQKVPGE